MNTSICVAAAWLALVGDYHTKRPIFKVLANILVLWMSAGAIAVTHAIGGQWKHISGSFTAFMPGKGGKYFVAMQAGGWAVFSMGQAVG